MRSSCLGTKTTRTKQPLHVIVQEWGRSSLALLDVREETRRLSAELLQQLDPRGRPGSSGGKGKEPRRLIEGEAVERLLREIEEKVGGLHTYIFRQLLYFEYLYLVFSVVAVFCVFRFEACACFVARPSSQRALGNCRRRQSVPPAAGKNRCRVKGVPVQLVECWHTAVSTVPNPPDVVIRRFSPQCPLLNSDLLCFTTYGSGAVKLTKLQVSGVSQRADSALATLDVTATQIRDAMACPPATASAAAAGDERDRAPCGEGVCAAAAI